MLRFAGDMRVVLSRPRLLEMAVSTGFCKRKSGLKPEIFFDMMCQAVSRTDNGSLSYMVSLLLSEYGLTMEKQSLHERFNENCVAFVRAVMSEVMRERFPCLYAKDFFPGFPRILIKDSTRFAVPSNLADHYGDCGGDAVRRSKAGVSIQLERDLKSGEVTSLSVTPGNRNDRRDAVETAGETRAGDLVIRDLGYFSTDVFKACIEKGAFFLSRLESGILVFDGTGKPVSFGKIYGEMKQAGSAVKEMNVLIGKEARLPVRMILLPVPEEVYAKRIRDKTAKSKGQGRGELAAETKIRCRFTLFVTSAEANRLPLTHVCSLYRLRWQIELLFKCCKSVFKIDTLHKMKEHRYIATLYVKLILILVSMHIAGCVQQSVVQPDKDKIRVISMQKALKTLRTLSGKILRMLRGTRTEAKKAALYILRMLAQNHWLESKKNKQCLPEILILFIWLSEE